MTDRSWFLPRVLGLIVALCSVGRADTRAQVDRTCPLCETRFKAVVIMSGTTFGMRLDLRPVGAIASPIPLAVCPRCGFVLDKDRLERYTDDEIKARRAVVESDAYKRLKPDDPSYLRLAFLYEGLKRPPNEIAHAYLRASWQTERNGVRNRGMLAAALAWLDQALAAATEHDKAWQTQKFLRGELLRRLGRFEDATRHFESIAGMKEFGEEPFPDMIAQERRFIRVQETGPQLIDQGEAFPVATEALVHVIGDEVKLRPPLGKAGAVTAASLVLVAQEDDTEDRALASDRDAEDEYRRAVDAGDRKLLARLIERGGAFPVSEGTRVLVRKSWSRATEWSVGLPSDPGGVRRVRVLDGKYKGRTGVVPARNLVPAP
jgi:hypothetical protein